ncbi:DNA replication initiation factor [Sulfuricaulis limicola]|uniref:DNA replication initiation factor n=1 Tax=Sulfuricaulis limicola TaxID=1620215 RepID=A0A1B4XDA5_9GAMM|nr:DnaA regulatory inactivator Hda [Sulfuricaulis limicola]BAV32813.1 DNA replication initiation factor [Sulfuricaulis limicola]
MSRQLALNLRLKDASSFGNFLAGPNREALEQLRAAVVQAATQAATKPAMIYLWGAEGVGKTHLLQAACRLAQELGIAPVYIPLADAALGPSLLEGLEETPLVCLDDVERVAGRAEWEAALFSLVERRRSTGGMLAVAASAPPDRLGLKLPDLASRLAWGTTYAMQPLSDTQKREAVQLCARHRGFEMPEDVASYILSRYPRDLPSLFELLDRIDEASLTRQRRVTIPFLRELEAMRYDHAGIENKS